MGVASGFGWSLLGIVVTLLRLYFWVLLIRALLSWVSPDPYNPIVRTLNLVTEPVLRPLRKLVPPHKLGGLDLSPLIAMLAIQFLINGLVLSFGGQPRFVI